MRILLDTHIFLWYISADSRLPDGIRHSIRNVDNRVYLSVVSVWEAIIKYQLGKLPLPQPPEIFLPLQRDRHQIASLPLDEASVTQLGRLPAHHRDPFDRILVCQALEHELALATLGDALKDYQVLLLESS